MIRRASVLALSCSFYVLTACAARGGTGGTPNQAAPVSSPAAPSAASIPRSSATTVGPARGGQEAPITPTTGDASAAHLQAALPPDLPGTWTCYSLSTGAGSPGNCAITVTIQADGSYKMGPGTGGTVRPSGKTVTFVGNGGLENWGPATIVKPGRMDFQWTDKDGYKYWAVFYKNEPDQTSSALRPASQTPSNQSAQSGSQTQPEAGQVGVSPSSARAGTSITVTARGVPPSAPIQVCVYLSSGRAIDCPKATSTPDGSLTVALDTTGYAPGAYSITILDSFSIPQAFHGAFTITP